MIKNMNNKGFAISTLLYGLLIIVMLILTLIISTMSYNRSSSKAFVSEVISDLEVNHSTGSISGTAPTISTSSSVVYKNLLYGKNYDSIWYQIVASDSDPVSYDSNIKYSDVYDVFTSTSSERTSKFIGKGEFRACFSYGNSCSCYFTIDSRSTGINSFNLNVSGDNSGVHTLEVILKENMFCDPGNNCNSRQWLQLATFSYR